MTEISCYLDLMSNLDKTVVAAKYFDCEELTKIYNLGVRNFGFNTASDLLNKQKQLANLNLTYHFIGHLQTNKVKMVINNIEYLHSLDSTKLAKEIQKYATRPIKTFIQLNISREKTKSGLFLEDIANFVLEIKKYDKIDIVGFMTIGVNSNLVETEEIFLIMEDLKLKYQCKLSMGMSADYMLALNHKADFIRIGSLFKGVIENGTI